MQNIPGIENDTTKEQLKTVSFSKVKSSDKQLLFSELFDQHSNRIENELALKPVSTNDKMLEVAPASDSDQGEHKVLTAAEDAKTPIANKNEITEETEEETVRDRDQRMAQEDFDEVKDDLKEYGMTDEEIAQIEEEINSEEGMTWGQFVSTLANKMGDMRKVSLSDGQKEQLSTFFAKFGFTAKESDKLINQLENGNQNEVITALRKKLDSMPEGQTLLFTKEEMQAFSSAMHFSKEFTTKIQEAFGQNMLPKEMKEAFTMIRQEMANMDEKDQNLVKAVGKQFVKSMGKDAKESTAAKDLTDGVDIKPRVAEDSLKGESQAELKENFKNAVEDRKDAMTAKNATKTAVPEKAEVDVNAEGEAEADDHWNNFFNKLQTPDNKTAGGTQQFQAKTETIESMLKTGLTEANAKTDTKSWEKVSAPKVMRQVENAFIKNLQNGTKQLTLQLTPENLGKLNILLQVQGKEVSATIRAENADSARLIADNVDIIKNSLEAQGLKVDKLEVQTGLSSDLPQKDWFGENEHNMSREREAMIAMRAHMKNMREGNAQLAQDMQSIPQKATVADQGLHIIA
jgi:flagellar hook-length control protein FliK